MLINMNFYATLAFNTKAKLLEAFKNVKIR